MASGIDPGVDIVELSVTARARRKSMGRLGFLVRESVRLVRQAGGRLFELVLLLQILTGLALAGQVIAVQYLLDAILRVEKDGSSPQLWASVLLFGGLTAVSTVLTRSQTYLQRLLGELVARSMWDKVLDAATSVNLRHFESPEFFNALQRVQASALTRPFQVTQGLMAMLGALVASVSVGVALASISPVLLPLLIAGGIPMLLTSRRESRLEFDFAVAQTPNQRMRTYLTLLQTGRDEAKEIRAFDLARWLGLRFAAVYDGYLAALSKHLRRRTLLAAIGSLGSAAVLILTLLILVKMISSGGVTVAEAGAAVVAIRLLSTQVQTLFTGVQQIFESGLFLDDVMQFLDLGGSRRPESRPEAPPSFSDLCATDITFTYPGAEEPALRGVSMSARAGEVIAIVGENGSGKTTLAKILAGLYEPDEGGVCWDGKDIRSWSSRTFRARIAVIFQDFVRYALSAQDNIVIGDVNHESDLTRAKNAAIATGIDDTLMRLPQEYDTILSRLFAGGQDLSGGQWQRMAIARCFYRDAPLVILDEPSAALDPRAEAELFSSLHRTLAGRTAIFISHRFSTVRAADRIYVMHGGHVVEHGSHDELMQADNQYAELFRLQAAGYQANYD